MSALDGQYVGKQALRMLAARTDSEHTSDLPLNGIQHVDKDGKVSDSDEAQMMWHVIDNVAHWDIDKVMLFTHGSVWNLELWQDSLSNPQHVFRLPK